MQFTVFLINLFSTFFGLKLSFSTTIRDNKLYTIYNNYKSQKLEIAAYQLNNGIISDISSNGRSYELLSINSLFKFTFLDVPKNLQDDNKLWLVADQEGPVNIDIENPYSNWMGYIDLTDMSLKPIPSIIKNLKSDRFPIFWFTRSIVTSNHESSLYIIGGSPYTDKNHIVTYSNIFYKYNFTTSDWVNMASISNGFIYPINYHSTLAVDNRFLYVLGGRSIYNSTVDSNSTFDSDMKLVDSKYLKETTPFNIWIYDIYEKIWKFNNIDIDIFDRGLLNIDIYGYYPQYYKENIYLVGAGLSNPKFYRPNNITKFGMLDIKTKKWIWAPLINEDGSSYNHKEVFRDSILFNDQLILISAEMYGNCELSLHVFDLSIKRMKTTLNVHNTDIIESNNETKDGYHQLPIYAIALIITNPNNSTCIINNSIQIIWSNPDNPSIEQVLSGGRNEGFYDNIDLSSTLSSYKMMPQNNMPN
ncbi:hypothetical protein CONCODRAFT_12622 [Conidiobolus coronatus NRRL 28638]|uniref:Galactose oxidase n=1 Tax=Conidiobolus coronatus (strain ATCC 28846 / CBS 209.66 / NRRL 28638) TaxID=796925 RepID=A0A137NSI6_CONC2|nr:hypothetical protein CONCODRAFT_12622 [Conidiobolus coronatus NRRL 28638]|eukprot:KXN65718.1 hypothetical protein CONCODRAFT_12622 [Conidiobolus coronatus NRRL 28638]